MNKNIACLAVVGALCLFAFVATESICAGIEQPDAIYVDKKDGPVFTVTFAYPSDNVTIRYACINGNRNGDLRVFARARSGTSVSQKMVQYSPVPGLNSMVKLGQKVNDFTLDTNILLDNSGFAITGLCFTKAGKESKPYSPDASTPADFPFTLTDDGQLRFEMSNCNTAQNR